MRWLIYVLLLLFSAIVFAAPRTITFPDACAKGKHLLIAAVGDVLLHQPLQNKAQRHGFIDIWATTIPYIKQDNVAFANIEGPLAHGINRAGKIEQLPYHAWNKRIYSGYPLFNYHPSLAWLRHLKNPDLILSRQRITIVLIVIVLVLIVPSMR